MISKILTSQLNELLLIHKSKKENSSKGIDHQSLEEKVYENIKNKIISHEVKPGKRLIDRNYAEEFQVSRSLVRNVFSVLEKEELITKVSRSGYYVSNITKKDVEEIYEIRKILESYCTKLSVPKLPENVLKEIGLLFNDAEKDLQVNKVKKMVEADFNLHMVLIDYCGNDRLIRMAYNYNDHYIFYRIIDLSRVERAKEAYLEHYNIYKATLNREADLASKLMEEHIEHAKKIILENFSSYTFD